MVVMVVENMEIRLLAHGTAWFDKDNLALVKQLMLNQSSATRSAYQAIHKLNLKNNDVKKYVKKNYMGLLNQRYISDACSNAKSVNQERSIFGGKKLWNKLINKQITKEEWQNIRNNQLYSTGDRTKQGNPNIRIDLENSKIYVNNPNQRGVWIEGKIWFPEKFHNIDFSCYDVRLILKKDNKTEVKVSWLEVKPDIKIKVNSGVIGIDCNPNGIAVVETNKEGNLLNHFYITKLRIAYTKENKRNYDIYNLAKEVVEYAKKVNKPITIEKLNFKKNKKYNKKVNKIFSNFCHKKILTAIERKANKENLGVIEVNPAFTSILGGLKYKDMYKLNIHTSAALVIARRGMNIKEKLNYNFQAEEVNNKYKVVLNHEGRGITKELTLKAWNYLQIYLQKPYSYRVDIGSGSNIYPPQILYFSENLERESRVITGHSSKNLKKGR